MTRTMPLTLMTLLGAAVAWWQLEALHGSLEAAVQVVFIMLSMLTFPHMVLTALAAANGPVGQTLHATRVSFSSYPQAGKLLRDR